MACGHPKAVGIAGFIVRLICSRYSRCRSERMSVSNSSVMLTSSSIGATSFIADLFPHTRCD
jgi:hypothetical protein